jgi:hypothetical protein
MKQHKSNADKTMRRLFAAALLALLALAASAQQTSSKAATHAANLVAASSSAPVQAIGETPTAQSPAITTLGSVKEKVKEDDAGDPIKWTDKAQSVFNGMLAFITLGLLIMGIRQEGVLKKSIGVAQRAAEIAEKTVRTMEETAAKELRSYVMVEQITYLFVPHPVTGEYRLCAKVTVKNYGSVPAKDVYCAIDFIIAQYPINRTLPPTVSKETIKIGMIAPNIPLYFTKELPQFDDAPDIVAGKMALYVIGQLTYHDGFQDNRTSTYQWYRSGISWKSPGDLAMSLAGNDIT